MSERSDSPLTLVEFDQVPEFPPDDLPQRRMRRRIPWGGLAGLALIAGLAQVRGIWPASALALVLMLTVPGLLFLRAIRVPSSAVIAFPLYVPCASLAILFAAGLATDLVGPLLGVDVPLRTLPLLVTLEAFGLALAAAATAAQAAAVVRWSEIRPRVLRAWPLSLPIVAAAGADVLTSGGGPAVAIAGCALVGVVLVAGLAVAPRLSTPQLGMILYGASLAAVWSYTLRGHFVNGFDISTEYHVAASTYANGIWRAAHPGDAYGAMLSLTVLPSMLHAISGATTLTLLKVVYPVLFAAFPAGVFLVARRVLAPRFAYLAAAFIAVQSYFFQQLPQIARQEIGLLIFLGLFAAILDRMIGRRARVGLIVALAASMVVSHYSTTYLAIGAFALAVVLQVILSRFRRVPAVSVPLLAALLAAAAAGAVWYFPVTHSSANLGNFTTSVSRNGFDLLPNARPGESIVNAYLNGNAPQRASASSYERLAVREYKRAHPLIHPLRESGHPRYSLRDASSPGAVVTAPAAHDAIGLATLLSSQGANLLAIIGALALVFRRRGDAILRGIGVVALATLAMLAAIRLSGTAADAYNQERAFLQTMVPLGIAMAWFVAAVANRGRRGAAIAVALAGCALAFIYLSTSGMQGVVTGGGTSFNLASSGEDYQRFYVSSRELASATWLAGAPRNAVVYTDRYGQLRYLAATGRSKGLFLDPLPQTLDRHAWVYASRANTVQRLGRGQIGSRYATYRWPGPFLGRYFDTVYSNGNSKVYHR
jgi:uncharacterized membrane protein